MYTLNFDSLIYIQFYMLISDQKMVYPILVFIVTMLKQLNKC